MDSLFDENLWAFSAYVDAAWRESNFSAEFDDFLWAGSVRIGPRFRLGDHMLFTHAVVDWLHAPAYEELWYLNRIDAGAGVSWYPKTDKSNGFVNDLARRAHVFAEVLWRVAELGDSMPDAVHEWDARAGIRFSTSGVYRQ